MGELSSVDLRSALDAAGEALDVAGDGVDGGAGAAEGGLRRQVRGLAGRLWPQSRDDVVFGHRIDEMLPCDFVETIGEFYRERMLRAGACSRARVCMPIPL